MESIAAIINNLDGGRLDGRFREIYVDESKIDYQRKRYRDALEQFEKLFPDEHEAEIYSAPGRSEVCGNHTDHQNGKVLGASVNLDMVAIVAKSEGSLIQLVSGDFPMECIDTARPERREEEENTTAALIRGVAAGIGSRGYRVGGFKAYVISDVPMGAGMSSSAAFEILTGTILSGLYNNGKISPMELAQIGQYAENEYFGKPCGLLDQMACGTGGMVYIDFEDKEHPAAEKVESDFEGAGLSLCIVETKGSHADLTPDYAAVTTEMGQVAHLMGKQVLREVSEEEFYQRLPELREKVSERALLRAIHFFEEEKRVEAAVAALKASDYSAFLRAVQESGNSSAKFLQNIYSPKDVSSQNISLALAVTEHFLGKNGVCRIHGGGFAGTIQAFVKNEKVEDYKEKIESVFGKGSCHILKVRPVGGICVW